MNHEITKQDNPAQTVATWRTATTYEQVFTHIPEGFGRVMAHLGANDIDPIGAPFTMFHQAPDAESEGDISMAVPVASGFPTADEIEVVELPAGATASVMHQGSYATLGESYAVLATWIAGHGHQIEGPAREVYMNSPADVDESELLTQIVFPIDAEETVVA